MGHGSGQTNSNTWGGANECPNFFSLATRIIELTPQGVVNFNGSYEEYLSSQEMGAT